MEEYKVIEVFFGIFHKKKFFDSFLFFQTLKNKTIKHSEPKNCDPFFYFFKHSEQNYKATTKTYVWKNIKLQRYSLEYFIKKLLMLFYFFKHSQQNYLNIILWVRLLFIIIIKRILWEIFFEIYIKLYNLIKHAIKGIHGIV